MTEYVAKKPNSQGLISYTDAENEVWGMLFERQMPIAKQYACDEYLEGIDILGFSPDKIPQIPDMNEKLQAATGWSVEPVNALISFDKFFTLLSQKKFPAATFIRTKEELDYLEEPDIFHEFFGHCPMITDQTYADFMQKYGELGVDATPNEQTMLARLYWFTVEFGLINTSKGLKVYGGGILSSIEETPYSVESSVPIRKTFDELEAFRTPYRIDILQTVYFIIKSYQELYHLLDKDLISTIAEANRLGMLEPTYPLQ